MLYTKDNHQAVVAHTFNPITQEAEAGGSLELKVSLILQSKFQDSQGYTEKPCLKTTMTITTI